jgi:hypothetical protein
VRRQKLRALILDVLEVKAVSSRPVTFSNLTIDFDARQVTFKGRTINVEHSAVTFPVLDTEHLIITKDGSVL